MKESESDVNDDSSNVSVVSSKQNHILNERQRRRKMNEKIQNLKDLLPRTSQEILTNKLAVLHESVQYIQHLQQVVSQLTERNRMLEDRVNHSESEISHLCRIANFGTYVPHVNPTSVTSSCSEYSPANDQSPSWAPFNNNFTPYFHSPN